MDNKLKGKKILFFSPAFFGYEYKIKDKMEEMGALVDYFDERSVTSAFARALLKVIPNIFCFHTKKYYSSIVNQKKNIKYDYIFFIRCDMPSKKILLDIKRCFPKAKMILYLYDSLKNIPNIESKLDIFDKVLSFDRVDCINNPKIKFRPLFYCDEYKMKPKENDNYKYDLCFIGTIHSDRYRILREIISYAKKENLSFYFYPYLQSKFIYYFYKMVKKDFRGTKISDFKFDKLSSAEISRVVDNSKIIIDIQHPKQTGLTMRTIEMIGMNKKIITTNEDIINYNFYDKGNILIIRRENPEVSDSFFRRPYNSIGNKIYEYYSLKEMIKEVFS